MPSNAAKIALGALAVAGAGVLVASSKARAAVAGSLAGGRWKVRLPDGSFDDLVYDDLDAALSYAVQTGGQVVTWPMRTVVSDFGGFKLLEDGR